MKRELIAAVALAVMVDGRREVIQPGQTCPDLSEHDTNELLRSGAVVDQSLERAQEHADKKAAADAMADFNAARKRVIAEQASAPQPQPAAPVSATDAAEPPAEVPAEPPAEVPAEPPAEVPSAPPQKGKKPKAAE